MIIEAFPSKYSTQNNIHAVVYRGKSIRLINIILNCVDDFESWIFDFHHYSPISLSFLFLLCVDIILHMNRNYYQYSFCHHQHSTSSQNNNFHVIDFPLFVSFDKCAFQLIHFAYIHFNRKYNFKVILRIFICVCICNFSKKTFWKKSVLGSIYHSVNHENKQKNMLKSIRELIKIKFIFIFVMDQAINKAFDEKEKRKWNNVNVTFFHMLFSFLRHFIFGISFKVKVYDSLHIISFSCFFIFFFWRN